MSRNTAESSWQRLLGWIDRQRQKPGEAISTGASHATETRELAKAEQVQAWEDEGGATAGGATGGSAEPDPPADLTR